MIGLRDDGSTNEEAAGNCETMRLRSPRKPDLLRHATKVGVTRSEAIHVDAIGNGEVLFDDVLRPEAGLGGDAREILAEFVTYWYLVGANGSPLSWWSVEEAVEMRRNPLRSDDPRIVFDEQRGIGGD